MLNGCPWRKFHKGCRNNCKKLTDDSQKQRVYCWEETLNHDIEESVKVLTIEECKKLVSKICNRYQIKPPEVVKGKWKRRANGGKDFITLPNRYRDRIAVVHETSHALEQNHAVKYDTYETREDHGPIFMRYVLENLSKELRIPIKKLMKTVEIFELKVARKKDCKL